MKALTFVLGRLVKGQRKASQLQRARRLEDAAKANLALARLYRLAARLAVLELGGSLARAGGNLMLAGHGREGVKLLSLSKAYVRRGALDLVPDSREAFERKLIRAEASIAARAKKGGRHRTSG